LGENNLFLITVTVFVVMTHNFIMIIRLMFVKSRD